MWLFYKSVLQDDHLSKTTTFEWSQEWLSYTGLTVYNNINYYSIDWSMFWYSNPWIGVQALTNCFFWPFLIPPEPYYILCIYWIVVWFDHWIIYDLLTFFDDNRVKKTSCNYISYYVIISIIIFPHCVYNLHNRLA